MIRFKRDDNYCSKRIIEIKKLFKATRYAIVFMGFVFTRRVCLRSSDMSSFPIYHGGCHVIYYERVQSILTPVGNRVNGSCQYSGYN